MMEERLRKYINRKFILYPKTKDILEVKEELLTIMLDGYKDAIALGLSELDSYKRAVDMMADYKDALKEVEKASSLNALKNHLINAIFFSSFYFISLTLVYLVISLAVVKSFDKTWLIVLGGAFIYLVYISFSFFAYARLFNFRRLSRLGIGLIFFTLVPLLYVFPSLYFYIIKGQNFWHLSWIAVLFIAFGYFLADYFVNKEHLSTFQRELFLILAGLSFTISIYLFLSFKYSIWSVSWIIFVVYLTIVSLVYYISTKKGRFTR